MSGLIGGAGSKSGVIGWQGINNPIALYTGEFSGDGSPSETSGYTYTCPLNTENDPSNLATLSSDTVTLSVGGRYYIEGHSGPFGFYSESAAQKWGVLKLVTSSGTINGHDFLGKDYGSFSNDWLTMSPVVKYTGLYDAGNTFKMQIETTGSGWNPLWWQGMSGVSQMPQLTLHYLGQN